MKLKSLYISLNCYGENIGRYTAKLEYEEENKGGVSLVLDPKVSDALLLCIGETVTKFAHAAALEVEKSCIASVQEARQAPAIENGADSA